MDESGAKEDGENGGQLEAVARTAQEAKAAEEEEEDQTECSSVIMTKLEADQNVYEGGAGAADNSDIANTNNRQQVHRLGDDATTTTTSTTSQPGAHNVAGATTNEEIIATTKTQMLSKPVTASIPVPSSVSEEETNTMVDPTRDSDLEHKNQIATAKMVQSDVADAYILSKSGATFVPAPPPAEELSSLQQQQELAAIGVSICTDQNCGQTTNAHPTITDMLLRAENDYPPQPSSTNLRRGNNVPTPNPEPGAVASMPSGPPTNVNNDASITWNLATTDIITTDTPPFDDGLVEAREVDAEENRNLGLPNATEVSSSDRSSANGQKIGILPVAAFCTIVGLTVGMVMGVILGANSTSSKDTMADTVAPTTYGSMEPSGVPSSSPTGALDGIFAGLPNHTLANLQIFGTPQWQAWEWLSNHQNITNLPDWRKTQLFALATTFYSLEGDDWNPLIKEGWLDDTIEECLWFSSGLGFWFWGNQFVLHNPPIPSCDDLGKFTSLHLDDLGLLDLAPSVPPEISLLTSLSRMIFRSDEIAGAWSHFLPTVLFEMTGLTRLQIINNDLTGLLPSELGRLTNLSVLTVQQNQLTGPLPSEIGLLTGLTVLHFPQNLFTGQIPTELIQLTELNQLWAFGCSFEGQIPSSIGQLSFLKRLWLSQNQFSGQIPEEVGQLTELIELEMHANQLSGQIPTNLGLLTSLKSLWLHRNLLSGTLPTEFWTMPNLQVMGVFDNFIGGTLASEMGLATTLEYVDLSGNQIVGTLPSEIGLMTSLEKVNLHDNKLTGLLPDELNVSMVLQLDGNQFSGTVPGHLCSAFWCDCSSSVTLVSDCDDLTVGMDLPGRFPPRAPDSDETIVFNFKTDFYSYHNFWVWQQATNTTDGWTTLQGSTDGFGSTVQDKFETLGILVRNHMHSFILNISSSTVYRLVISDWFGNGLSEDVYGEPGWISVTGANQTVLYSLTNTTYFTQLTITMSVGDDGLVEATSVLYCDPNFGNC